MISKTQVDRKTRTVTRPQKFFGLYQRTSAKYPYLVALIVMGVLLVPELLCYWIFGFEEPFVQLAICIVASTIGLGPALWVTFLAVLSKAYFFIPPDFSFDVGGPVGLIQLGVFTAVALMMSYYLSQLQRLRSNLESTINWQKTWVASVSHELRTPLNGILGFIRLLKDTSLDLQQRQHLELVDKSAQRLKKLVSEILDFSRLKSNANVVIERSIFNSENEVHALIDIVQSKAHEKGLSLSVQVQGFVAPVWSDSGKIMQILGNFLENAIKFTSFGSVQVHIKGSKENGGLKLEISVIDTGPGISEHDVRLIFQPFFRGGKTIRDGVEGTGLGLAICSDLAKLIGAQIAVTSELGIGSSFKLSLNAPLVDEKIVEFNRQASAFAEEQCQPIKKAVNLVTLVAEDNRINQQLMLNFLEKMGFRVDMVSNGLEAVRAAESFNYDLILLDFHMPVMDGLKAAHAIRKHYEKIGYDDYAIVGVTADASAEAQVQAQQSGIQNLLLKPIAYHQLRMMVDGLRAEKGNVGLQLNEISRISNLLGEKVTNEILKIFIDQCPQRRQTLKDLFGSCSFTELADMSHNLKSSCLAICAVRCAELCTDVELAAKHLVSFPSSDSKRLASLLTSLDFELELCENQIRRHWPSFIGAARDSAAQFSSETPLL